MQHWLTKSSQRPIFVLPKGFAFYAELWLPWQPKGKTLKIFLSETIRPRAQIFGIQHPLVELYKDCSNYFPGVKIGPAPGVTSFYIDLYRKSLKIFFSQTTMRTAQIFGMKHCLVDIYQVCLNYVPWAKIGHAPGFSQFTLIYIGKNHFSLKLMGLDLGYLVLSIVQRPFTNIV